MTDQNQKQLGRILWDIAARLYHRDTPGMGRAFSPREINASMNLGHWPRLV